MLRIPVQKTQDATSYSHIVALALCHGAREIEMEADHGPVCTRSWCP